ncbi:MAG: hypothetical protein WEB03_13685 [Nitriliruptor sp.]|uniref:hypothetical protein n=1 Tax=Nitriliruptor sp. TaxID=2448056 RepID=UPI00349FE969
MIEVTVAVTGGSLATSSPPAEQVPADPEEAGQLAVALDGETITPAPTQPCPVDDPCTEVTFPVETTRGEHTLAVEFRRGDGVPFTPLVTDRITFTKR